MIKEIKSKDGVLHFRRYLLFSTKWFDCYLHRIYMPDNDLHLHNHPWSFWGIILWGEYIEEKEKGFTSRGIGSWAGGDETYFHKIKKIVKTTTSLFFVGKKTNVWGYKTSQGFIDHETYRQLKHSGNLPKN